MAADKNYNCTDNIEYYCCLNINKTEVQLQNEMIKLNCENTKCNLTYNCSKNEIWSEIICCKNESICNILSNEDQCKLLEGNINRKITTSIETTTDNLINKTYIQTVTNDTIRIVSSTTSTFNHSSTNGFREDNISDKSIVTTDYSVSDDFTTNTNITFSTNFTITNEISTISFKRKKLKNSDDKVKLTIVIAVPAASIIFIILIGIVIFLLCRNRYMNKRRGKSNGSMVYFNQEDCHRIATIYDSIQISDNENDNSKYEDIDTSYTANHLQFPYSFLEGKREGIEKNDNKPDNVANPGDPYYVEKF